VSIHAEKSAEVFVAPTNQFVDGEVSHSRPSWRQKHGKLKTWVRCKVNRMRKNTPLLCDRRLDE